MKTEIRALCAGAVFPGPGGMVGSEPSCVCARSAPGYTSISIARPDNHVDNPHSQADGSAAHGYAKTTDCHTDPGPIQLYSHAEATNDSAKCPGHFDRERAAVPRGPGGE
jgi:hypothetical protein